MCEQKFELGEVMKKHRERRGLSQRDVANRLDYRNINFISMIERGGSLIPVPRLNDFCNAYELDAEIGFVIFAIENKASFTAIMNLDKSVSGSAGSSIAKNFGKSWAAYQKLAKDLGVNLDMVIDELLN
jgi:transcriptional regulator with XRE-family HTH domain